MNTPSCLTNIPFWPCNRHTAPARASTLFLITTIALIALAVALRQSHHHKISYAVGLFATGSALNLLFFVGLHHKGEWHDLQLPSYYLQDTTRSNGIKRQFKDHKPLSIFTDEREETRAQTAMHQLYELVKTDDIDGFERVIPHYSFDTFRMTVANCPFIMIEEDDPFTIYASNSKGYTLLEVILGMSDRLKNRDAFLTILLRQFKNHKLELERNYFFYLQNPDHYKLLIEHFGKKTLEGMPSYLFSNHPHQQLWFDCFFEIWQRDPFIRKILPKELLIEKLLSSMLPEEMKNHLRMQLSILHSN